MDEINTLGQLVDAVRDSKTGGYDVDFDILPNKEFARAGDGTENASHFFLVIEVSDSEPGSQLNGQWWFWADHTVMQVL